MKIGSIILLLALLLTGCGGETEPVYETVGQIQYEQVAEAEPQAINVWVPDDTAVQTGLDAQSATIYTWTDYELRVQTVNSGDIQQTLKQITGLDYDALTVMAYEKNGLEYYQTVWSTSGEDGVYLGRTLIADDGDYHYCVSLVSPEKVDSEEVYAEICGSFNLGQRDAEK